MTFYPFQWDLNFTNPIVFNEMMHNILFLTNLGVDFLLFNGSPSLWKKAGTSCKMLKKSNVLNFLIFSIMKIVCPGVIVWIDVIQHKDKKEYSDSNLQLDETKKKNEDSRLYTYNDESDCENENDFIVTDSGVIITTETTSTTDTHNKAQYIY